MSVVEKEIVSYMSQHPTGAVTQEVESYLVEQGINAEPGLLEAIMLLSPRFHTQNNIWYREISDKAEAVYEALETYGLAYQDKAVFKLDNVLANVPLQLQPTIGELPNLINQSGKYVMLKNNMVRRKK